MNYWAQSKSNIFVAAHRGFCSNYPENTLLAFREALKLGVDLAVEMGVELITCNNPDRVLEILRAKGLHK